MSRRSWMTCVALATAFHPSLTSCTLVGAGIGAVIDSGNKSTLAPTVLTSDTLGQTQRLEPGRWIGLKLNDGSKLRGRYRGIATITADETRRAVANVTEMEAPGAAPAEPDTSISGSVIVLDLSKPSRSQYTLDSRDRRTAIVPLELVRSIEIGTNKGKTVGMIVGGVIDLTVITAVVVCAASDCFEFGFSSY